MDQQNINNCLIYHTYSKQAKQAVIKYAAQTDIICNKIQAQSIPEENSWLGVLQGPSNYQMSKFKIWRTRKQKENGGGRGSKE